MNTQLKTLAQAPLGVLYVTLIVLQRHRLARVGATLTVLVALVGACALASS